MPIGGETMKHLGPRGDRACGAHAFDGESVYSAAAVTCPACLDEIARIRAVISKAREVGAADLADSLARYLGEDEDTEDEECDCRACDHAKAEANETLARRCDCRRG